jgi:putative flippase GtrA
MTLTDEPAAGEGLRARLPRLLRRHATPARIAIATEFVKFGIVGVVGFFFDTATVYALRHRFGLIAAGFAAYLVAATVTWSLNRIWTFGGRGQISAPRQWGLFLALNAVGMVLNRGTYVALVTVSPVCAAEPVLAIAAGCLAGLTSNFLLSRAYVFR